MNRCLKWLFFALIVKPIIWLALGPNIRNRQQLPGCGPAILAANHNSHLDTMVLMSLYPLSKIHRIRPVAAADYFLKNRLLAWFSLNVLGIIPLDRRNGSPRKNLFSQCLEAIDQGDILILFPEGSRGEPEQISQLKKGLFHLHRDRPMAPVTPVMMRGLGRALPKGKKLLVPFSCDVVIGSALKPGESSQQFIDELRQQFELLEQECITSASTDHQNEKTKAGDMNDESV